MYKTYRATKTPFHLQLFAEGADTDAGASGEDNGGEPQNKTFTQADVSNIAAREAKKAREKLLRDLGLSEDAEPGAVKARLAKLAEQEESQKNELQKATESLAGLTEARDAATAKAALLERKFTALTKGVPADRADAYVKLAELYIGEDADFDKALSTCAGAPCFIYTFRAYSANSFIYVRYPSSDTPGGVW
jgi:hypothetical protein